MIQVTFRLARESDRAQYNWRRYGVNRLRPVVVTVRGVDRVEKRREMLALVFEGDQVVFQNGAPGIADLIRAWHRVQSALDLGLEGADAEQRQDRRFAQAFAWMRDTG